MPFFPDPRRRGEIAFIFAKSMPYAQRMLWIVLLMLAGLAAELFLNYFLGLFLMACGTALSLVRGYSASPDLGREEEKWSQVTPDEYSKIKLKQEQLKKWDTDSFDITNGLGCFIFVAVAGLLLFLSIRLLSSRQEALVKYLVGNAAVILLPHWFTGIRTYLRKDRLIIKIDLLEKIMAVLAPMSDIQVLPMLSTVKTREGRDIPMDARLMLKFLGAPDYFLGLQVQISLNNVQGRDYPYLYCVLISKKGTNLFRKDLSVYKSLPPNTTYEVTDSKDVDVLVLRQTTTRTSGYYTSPSAAVGIVAGAVKVAGLLLK